MIIATAGHVDHGKPPKRAHWIKVIACRKERRVYDSSIWVTPYWPQPDGRVLGFIDVPGHEKFSPQYVLAGGGIVIHALLVVACDDGGWRKPASDLAIP